MTSGFAVRRLPLLLRLNRAPEAVSEYEAGFRLGPVSPETFLGYATALVSAGRRDEGMDYFAEYTRNHARDPSASFTVGQLLLGIGRLLEAIAYLAHAQALAPGSAEVEALLVRARQQSSRDGGEDPVVHSSQGQVVVTAP